MKPPILRDVFRLQQFRFCRLLLAVSAVIGQLQTFSVPNNTFSDYLLSLLTRTISMLII